MSNPWNHLPNAKHIDAILASIKAHPKEWGAAWGAASSAARGAAYYAARGAATSAAWEAAKGAARKVEWGAAYYAARGAAGGATQGTARDAAWDAIIALIAYDDCAYMLNSTPDELEILAKLGDRRAILLLPACKAFAA